MNTELPEMAVVTAYREQHTMPNLIIKEDGTIQFTEEQERWLDALESNEFLQGKNQLHTSEGPRHYYCCLGIACKVMGNYEPEVWSASNAQSTYSYNGATATLPNDVMFRLGLRTAEGSFDVEPEWYKSLPLSLSRAIDSIFGIGGYKGLLKQPLSLTQLNDRGITFTGIAGIIRSNPPGLFARD